MHFFHNSKRILTWLSNNFSETWARSASDVSLNEVIDLVFDPFYVIQYLYLTPTRCAVFACLFESEA